MSRALEYDDPSARADLGFVLACVAVFFSPMNYLRISAVYFTATDMVTILALAVMLARGQIPRQPFGQATGAWFVGFLLLGGGLVIGSLAHGSALSLLTVLLQYGFSLVALPLLLAGRPRWQVMTLMRVLMHSIAFVMLFGIWMVHFVPNPPLDFVSPNGRLRSLAERENEIAALGAVAVVILSALWQARRMRLVEAAIVLPALLYGIMLTGSNTGMLCLALGVVLMPVLTGSWRMLAVILAAAMVVAGLVLFHDGALLPAVFRQRVLTGVIEADITQSGTFSGRLLLMQEAFGLAADHLIVGVGAQRMGEVSIYGHAVHNSYLLLLNEGGLISLLGLVILLIAGLPAAFARLSRPQTRLIGATTLTIILIFALMLNTFPHFYARFWNVPLILAMALSVSPFSSRGWQPVITPPEAAHA